MLLAEAPGRTGAAARAHVAAPPTTTALLSKRRRRFDRPLLRSFHQNKPVSEGAMAGPKIFFSYSSKDGEIVTGLIKLLRTVGGQVFRDSDSILGGVDWRDEIAKGIDDADIMLVFWTKNAGDSEEVR